MIRDLFTIVFITCIVSSCSSSGDQQQALKKLYAGKPASWPAPQLDSGIIHQELAPLPEVKYPADNPYSAEKAKLGKMLFFDPRLSKSGTIACASCHDPELGWADGKSKSFGHERRQGGRNAMTILNVAFYHELFWDGRATSLEEQVSFPLQDSSEMSISMNLMVDRINSVHDYKPWFEKAFGTSEINATRIQAAIATFERSIVSRKSKFDRFVAGDTSALDEQELLGLHLFRTKARCMNCHNGALFSDNNFHNLGQSHLGRPIEDLGRYHITGEVEDVGKFRTPSLRDVAFTAPYMHHGLVIDLNEMIDLYNAGMPQLIPRKENDNPLFPEKSPHLKPLELTSKEKDALIAFLNALSTRPYRVDPPDLPR